MECIVTLKWHDDEDVWTVADAITNDGKSIGVTLSSGSFDALVERVKPALLELLEMNFNYIGEVKMSIITERVDKLKPISWKPRPA